jgi:topoisomerase IA-like protein
MKKLITIALGLGLVLGLTTATFAQDKATTAKKTTAKKTTAKKTTAKSTSKM